MSTRYVCILALASCFQPAHTADERGEGVGVPADLFAPDASTVPECQRTDPSPLSGVRVRVRTTAPGGRFAPRNVGAIWIERADGTFVKTAERWGLTRARWLARFESASQQNIVDAVTGATLLSHRTHEVTWDLRDLEGCEIAAGDYRAVVELTDKNGPGPSLAIPFAKDQTPVLVAPPDEPTFHDLELQLF